MSDLRDFAAIMAAKALSPAAIVDVADLGACHGVTTAYFNGQCIGVVNDPKFYPNLGVNMPAGAAWAVSSTTTPASVSASRIRSLSA